ncbi:MAG: GNAT family N-acetyltransferase [Oscillospiraceae bacterium]|jgi:GNAT superfamily N-acetyltransferase
MEFSIREITQEMLPAFEPYLLPQSVESLYEEDGARAFGAVCGEQTCGAAMGVVQNGVLYLMSLFVDEKVRREGIGTALLKALTDAAGTAAAEADWILPDGPFEEMDAFLQKNGFSPAERGGDITRLDTRKMRADSVLRRAFSPAFRPDGNIIPLAEMTDEQRRELYSDEEIDPFLRAERFAALFPCSSVCLGYRYGGRITAYFIAEPVGPHEGVVRAIVARKGAPPAAVLQLCAAGLNAGLPLIGGDGYLWMDTINDASRALAARLAGSSADFWHEGSASRDG